MTSDSDNNDQKNQKSLKITISYSKKLIGAFVLTTLAVIGILGYITWQYVNKSHNFGCNLAYIGLIILLGLIWFVSFRDTRSNREILIKDHKKKHHFKK